jgi:hypothetical protein
LQFGCPGPRTVPSSSCSTPESVPGRPTGPLAVAKLELVRWIGCTMLPRTRVVEKGLLDGCERAKAASASSTTHSTVRDPRSSIVRELPSLHIFTCLCVEPPGTGKWVGSAQIHLHIGCFVAFPVVGPASRNESSRMGLQGDRCGRAELQ